MSEYNISSTYPCLTFWY